MTTPTQDERIAREAREASERAAQEAAERTARTQKLATRLKGQLDTLAQAKSNTQEITTQIAQSAEEIRKTVKTNAAFHGDLDLEQEATLLNIVASNMRLAGVIQHALSRAQSLDHRLLSFYEQLSRIPEPVKPLAKKPVVRRTTSPNPQGGMVDSLTSNSLDALFAEVPDL